KSSFYLLDGAVGLLGVFLRSQQRAFFSNFNGEQPAGTVGIFVDAFGILDYVLVGFHDRSGDRRVQFRNGFSGFQFATDFAGGYGITNFWQFGKHDVPELIGSVVGNADAYWVFIVEPFVFGGVA